MEDKRTFQEKSFQTNVDNALEKLTNLEFYRLNNYLNSTFLTEEPDEPQTEFLDEIFGLDNWTAYVEEYNNYIMSNKGVACKSLLPRLKEYLYFKLNHIFLDVLAEKNKSELAIGKLKIAKIDEETQKEEGNLKLLNLKVDLSNAINNSYDEEGIFWKDDGWCNVYDVLQKHKLVKQL